MKDLSILLIIILTGITARFVSLIIHEMGHGLAALFLTRQRIDIYIGSHGDKSKSIKLILGRLTVYFKPFGWKGGLCDHKDGDLSAIKNIVIILSGPIANLILGIFSFWLIVDNMGNSFIGFLSFILFTLFMVDFFVNILPNGRQIILSDGRITYNDGELLKRTVKLRKMPKDFWHGINLYNNGDYAKAAEMFGQLLSRDYKGEELYRFAFSAYIMSKNYKAADDLLPDYLSLVKPNADDYCNIGLVKQCIGDMDSSILNYNRSMELNPKNWITYNNRGYAYNLSEEYEKAIHNFDMAINLSPKSAFPYNNRGFAFIKTGRLEEGFRDIQKSLQLDDRNSYAYRNLGIYYWEVKDYEKAFQNFTKAFEIDKDTPEVGDFLLRLKQITGKS